MRGIREGARVMGSSFLRRGLRSWFVAAVLWVPAVESALGQGAATAVAETSRIQKLIEAATQSSQAFPRLAELCDSFGSRLGGSTNLEAAIDWALNRLKEDGFEKVRGEPVQVPHWVRGQESLEELGPLPQRLPLLGLGGTTNTPPGGIEAGILVVTNFTELEQRASEARGRIVVFHPPFTEYGDTVRYRGRGASAAAKVGAVASLIRSVTPFSLRTPHTGMMQYEPGVPRIPHAAITVEDAARFQRLQARGIEVRLRLQLGAQTLPDATSRNVVAEIRGRERPGKSSWSAAISIPGMSGRGPWTTAAVVSPRGKPCA